MPCRKVKFNITGKINITCFKLLEETTEESRGFMSRWKERYPQDMDVFEEQQLEVSLAYDSFKVLTYVLDHDDLTSGKTQLSTKPCLNYSNYVASHHTTIGNLLQKVSQIRQSHQFIISLIGCQFQLKISDGVTGNIEFTEVGLRKNYQLQILDVGFTWVNSRIANWSDDSGLKFEKDAVDATSKPSGGSPIKMRVTTVHVSLHHTYICCIIGTEDGC